MWFDKTRAFALHLLFSLLVIALCLALIYFVWYPYPYFKIEQVWDVLKVVILVDVLLGPLCTFVVYRRDKPRLNVDLSIIIVLQLLALAWGMSVAYKERPVYVALVKTMFSVVPASSVDQQQLPDPSLRSTGWGGGPRVVYVDLPFDDPAFMAKVEQDMEQGMKLAFYAEYYRDAGTYLPAAADDIDQRIRLFPQIKGDIDRLVAKHGGSKADYLFYSFEGRRSVGLLVVRRTDGQVIDALLADASD
ncbi:MAG: hypothetical protein HY940_09445 [Gammaproteobacteria bacterium]|nr:hypothetical protein [Gammaproteobacteria bacterium]